MVINTEKRDKILLLDSNTDDAADNMIPCGVLIAQNKYFSVKKQLESQDNKESNLRLNILLNFSRLVLILNLCLLTSRLKLLKRKLTCNKNKYMSIKFEYYKKSC